jgi:hypothetical protein
MSKPMSPQCPGSPETVDEKTARMTAFLTVVLLLAGLFSTLQWIALLLSFDFLIRGFTRLPISPLRRAARAQAKILRMKPKAISAGPQIFAAKIGFIIAAAITLLSLAGLHTAARLTAELMVLAAGLEAFAGICLGGKIHSLLNRP